MLRLALRLVVLLALAVSAAPASAQYFGFGKNRVQYREADWRTLQTAHFDVYFYERDAAPGGQVLATFAAEAAEEAYREVSALFGGDVARRIPLLVYPTHPDFAVTNAVELPVYAEGIGGVTELFKNRIAVPFTGDWRAFRQVVHHELVHAVLNDLYYGGSVQSLIRSGARLQIPGWFNEGLAEFSALGWDTQSDMYVREALLEDRLPDIARLGGFFAYRGGQSVWDYVAQEYGREKVTEILDRVRLGRSVDGAFRRATGLGLRELSERWKRALRAAYYPEVAVREDAEAIARPIASRRVSGGWYHASPALSPQGDRVAYVSTEDGLFDVVVAQTGGRRPPETVVEGQDNVTFESLRILSPGLAWSPDGRRLAVAVTSGPGDALALVDVETREVESIRPPGVDAVVSVAWSPDGTHIAFEGVAGAHSDLYVLELATGAVANLTRDLYSDHAPAWAPDGRSIVFHSDRGDALALGIATARAAAARAVDTRALGRRSHDLYRLDLDAPRRVERLTDDELWDETRPALADGPGGPRLLFISDRNGVPNLYALDLATRASHPLTDLQTGVLDVSLSADGRRAVFLALDDGSPSVFFLRDPFGRADLPPELAPTIWAQRRTGRATGAPALELASTAIREQNPFLRDAADGRPPPPPPRRAGPPTPEELAFADSILALAGPLPEFLASTDTLALDPTAPERGSRVDFRAYDFSDAFDGGGRLPRRDDPFRPVGNRDSTGALLAREYKLRFTLDLISAAGSYDTVYGVQSVTQLLFSDVLGDHRVGLATNLVLDLRNADYVLSYQNRARRTQFGLEGFHLARQLRDPTNRTIYRYRNYGVVASARRPLDKFRRVDAEVGLLGVSLTDLSDLGERARSRLFAVPRVTYTVDHTVPGRLGPSSGVRYAGSLSGAPGPDAFFVTAIADGRRYWPLGQGFGLALRGSAGLSVGPDPQRFYAAGVQNWVKSEFRSLPVESPDDFVFATPVLPIRGFGFNEAAGDRFALVNAEVRVPLIAALLPGPVPLVPLYDVQTVAFVDAGMIADGGLDVFRTVMEDDDDDPETEPVEYRVFEDVLLGAGVGLRTFVLGYPVRLDWGWPFDGREVGDGRLYFSVGLDF
ncbi:peptidase MA family metallohydrolase [Rubrivirga sp. IMCC43871]|uniref:peptidase MA family metallohydrolase n=1 Tax=Rubrivirga sp. IMCC43871 TaxID=3391575 RepID=UPI00399038D7